jgi:hypothetical protein
MSFYEELGFSQTYRFPPDGKPEYVTMSRGSSSNRHQCCERNREGSFRPVGIRR